MFEGLFQPQQSIPHGESGIGLVPGKEVVQSYEIVPVLGGQNFSQNPGKILAGLQALGNAHSRKTGIRH